MSKISNRFYVTALEDGTTIHGSLAATKALSQAYNNSTGACVPNWKTDTSSRPTIYLNLLEGNTQVLPTDYKWYYNGVEIDFTAENCPFSAGTYPVDLMDDIPPTQQDHPVINMPAITIVENLAASTNVDLDTITIKGTKEVTGTTLEFSATCQIKISTMTSGSDIGIINFVDGVSDITEKDQTITMYGVLYDDTGSALVGATTEWYLNDAAVGTPGSNVTISGTTYSNAFQVTEAQVTDYATIRCEFYYQGNLMYTSYVGIDDMQDPEFLYIQYNGNQGNAASLRKGEKADFTMWIGTRDDSSVMTPAGSSSVALFRYMRVQLLNGSGGVVYTDDITDDTFNPTVVVPDVISGTLGWRELPYDGSSMKHYLTLTYNIAASQTFQKNVTGIIMASDEPFA